MSDTRFGKNSSVSGEVTITDAIPVSITTTKIWDASVIPVAQTSPPFISMIATNSGNKDAWIKFQPADTDDDIKGFKIYANTTTTIMDNGDIYPGEISARTTTGSTLLYLTVF